MRLKDIYTDMHAYNSKSTKFLFENGIPAVMKLKSFSDAAACSNKPARLSYRVMDL